MKHLTLQTTLKFNVDDLKANRDGRVSTSQLERYKPAEVNRMAVYVILGHAFLIGGLLATIAVVTAKPAMWIVVGIVGAAAFLPFIMLNNEGNIRPALKSDVLSGKVSKASGVVILREVENRQFDLYVEGVTLRISASQAAAFVHEDSYCVYYFPRSLMLLSAEPL